MKITETKMEAWPNEYRGFKLTWTGWKPLVDGDPAPKVAGEWLGEKNGRHCFSTCYAADSDSLEVRGERQHEGLQRVKGTIDAGY